MESSPKFAVLMLADPAAANLSQGNVNQLCDRWNGSQISWLRQNVAVEFLTEAYPSDLDAVCDEQKTNRIDVAVVSTVNRRKSLLVADMDSTIIRQECVDELARVAGIVDEVASITNRVMNGEIDFESGLRQRVALLRNMPGDTIQSVWDSQIKVTPGARELVGTMRAQGARCALISGGFTEFTGRVSSLLGFDEHFANRLVIEQGKLTGEVTSPVLDRQAKKTILKRLMERKDFDASQVIAVGDGANDLEMLAMAGLGVAFWAKPVVAQQCRVRIDFCDLTALLYLQGYRHHEFSALS